MVEGGRRGEEAASSKQQVAGRRFGAANQLVLSPVQEILLDWMKGTKNLIHVQKAIILQLL